MKNPEHKVAAALLPQNPAAVKILQARAQKLALAGTPAHSLLGSQQYICFELGKNHFFGIDFHYVKEVMGKKALDVTPLPLVPAFVAGTTNYRGALLALLDLRQLFASSDTALAEVANVIIVHTAQMTVGVLIGDVAHCQPYHPDALTPGLTLSGNDKLKSTYVAGLHQGNIAILNITAILQDYLQELKGMTLASHQTGSLTR